MKFHFQALTPFGSEFLGHSDFKREKANNPEYFFRLNFNYDYMDVDNGEGARVRDKRRRRISLEEQNDNFIAVVRK